MDVVTAIVIIIAVFAGLFFLAMLFFPDFRGAITGPWGTKLDLKGKRGSEERPSGSEALMEDVDAGRDAAAEAQGPGARATMRRTAAGRDAIARAKGSEGDSESKKE